MIPKASTVHQFHFVQVQFHRIGIHFLYLLFFISFWFLSCADRIDILIYEENGETADPFSSVIPAWQSFPPEKPELPGHFPLLLYPEILVPVILSNPPAVPGACPPALNLFCFTHRSG
jgi:hypothetical protein